MEVPSRKSQPPGTAERTPLPGATRSGLTRWPTRVGPDEENSRRVSPCPTSRWASAPRVTGQPSSLSRASRSSAPTITAGMVAPRGAAMGIAPGRSFTMSTPRAPASSAWDTFVPNGHPPRPIRAMRPSSSGMTRASQARPRSSPLQTTPSSASSGPSGRGKSPGTAATPRSPAWTGTNIPWPSDVAPAVSARLADPGEPRVKAPGPPLPAGTATTIPERSRASTARPTRSRLPFAGAAKARLMTSMPSSAASSSAARTVSERALVPPGKTL